MIDTVLNKPISFLTVGELVAVLKSEFNKEATKPSVPQVTIRGIHGLAKELGISPVTAQSLKNSGKIPYSQFGRVVLFDKESVQTALALIGKPRKG